MTQVISLEQLNKIFPAGAKSGRNAKVLDSLNTEMNKREIDTVNRIAGFLSQIGVESEEFLYTKELGGNSYFAKYDAGTSIGKRLGNTQPGDGAKFKGRGFIQVTGRANYTQCGKDLGLDLVNNPQILEQIDKAILSAGWYWNLRNINAACDVDNIVKITKLVNGGTNHLDRRTAYYKKAKQVLSV